MIAAVCQHENRRTNGRTKAGAVRYRCKSCGASWTESTAALNGMRVGLDQAAKVVEMFCEGMSVSATARIEPSRDNASSSRRRRKSTGSIVHDQ